MDTKKKLFLCDVTVTLLSGDTEIVGVNVIANDREDINTLKVFQVITEELQYWQKGNNLVVGMQIKIQEVKIDLEF